VVRTVYEIRTFEALCAQLRCKGIWVVGADEFRNPDEDLVTDFAEHRTEHYAELRKPLDPGVFVSQLRDEMRAEMQALNDALEGEGLPWLQIAPRGPHGAIRLTPLEALPEPVNLGRLKKAIGQQWGMLPLIDVVKEAVLRSGCLEVIETKVGRGGKLGPEVLLERLLLVLYAYGTGRGHPGGGRRRARPHRTRPVLRAALAFDAGAGGGAGHPDRQRDLRGPPALDLG